MAYSRLLKERHEKTFGRVEDFGDIDKIMKTLAKNPALKTRILPNGNNLLHYFASTPQLREKTDNFKFLAFRYPELLIGKNKRNETPLHVMNRYFPNGGYASQILLQLVEICVMDFEINPERLPPWSCDLFREYKNEIFLILLNEKKQFSNFMYGLLNWPQFEFIHNAIIYIVADGQNEVSYNKSRSDEGLASKNPYAKFSQPREMLIGGSLSASDDELSDGQVVDTKIIRSP